MLLGASGAGKSVVLKLILGLFRPDSGTILVNGQRVDRMSEHDLLRMRGDIGMLFQETALFDSLTVAENVGYRSTKKPTCPSTRYAAAWWRSWGSSDWPTTSTGSPRSSPAARGVASRSPARWPPNPASCCSTTRPSGLDPVIAATVDDEIVKLRDLEHVTSILVTHQIRDAFYIARHEAVTDRRRPGDPATAPPSAPGSWCSTRAGFTSRGPGAELLASSSDAYLKEFLFMTLPPW